MTAELTFQQKLQNYAQLAVKVGVNLQPGQRLMLRAPVESAPLVRLVTEEAYKTGARLVDVMWSDDAVTLARFNYAPRDSFESYPSWRADGLIEAAEDGDAFLSIHATDPELLKDQDPDLIALTQRVYQTQLQPFYEYIMNDEVNWAVISYPLPSWAEKIFPDDPADEQIARLWAAIFATCRVDQANPVAAWEHHLARLAQKRDYLNAKQYAALSYRGPGTDLSLGLPDHHLWHGGRKATNAGLDFIPNLPTEEVFSMPHKERVDGVVNSSKPLSYGGVLIEDFTLTFEQGKIVKATAKKGESTLRRLIDTDEGAARLGEVALVPHSSPISQSGLLFFNTLFDENAASHLALGRAYRFCIEGGTKMTDEAFAAAGGNTSLAHVDFMIGSDQLDIDGVTADGSAEPLMRGGEWAV